MTARDDIEAVAGGVLGVHFIVWRALDKPGGPLGEWSCTGCDLTFGFSNTAIAHVAAVLAEALAPVVAEVRAEALREAADRWTQGAWADVMLPKPTPPAVPVIAYANRVGDWLRARADESGA